LPNFRLVLEYDGTDFEGWQAQPQGQRTVQGELQAALARVAGGAVAVIGAGRTDAGVHAEGQVASASVDTRLAPETLQRALNAILPRDVAVRELAQVDAAFHARRDAQSKLYAYRIWNATTRSPLRERRALWVSARLDVPAMREAAGALVGTRDFASFQAAGSSPGPTVRTLDQVALEAEGAELCCCFEARGFLRHMVRTLVGTLLDVGRGRRSPDSIAALLAARDRSQAGPTAPAHGLTLVRVSYRDFRPQSEALAAKRVDGSEPHG
jgi:tRNA pseudouridine38-40 synthase